MSEEKKDVNNDVPEVKPELKDFKAEQKKAIEASGNKIVDLYYNEEEMALLNGFLGFVPDSHLYYTPDVFYKIPKEKRPIFKYRPRNQSDDIALFELAKENGIEMEQAFQNPVYMRLLIKRCLKGWKNFRDKRGTEIKCEMENGSVSDKSIDKMSITLLTYVALAIMTSDSLSDKEMVGLEF